MAVPLDRTGLTGASVHRGWVGQPRTPPAAVLGTLRALGVQPPDTYQLIETLDRLLALVLEVVLLADNQLPNSV